MNPCIFEDHIAAFLGLVTCFGLWTYEYNHDIWLHTQLSLIVSVKPWRRTGFIGVVDLDLSTEFWNVKIHIASRIVTIGFHDSYIAFSSLKDMAGIFLVQVSTYLLAILIVGNNVMCTSVCMSNNIMQI